MSVGTETDVEPATDTVPGVPIRISSSHCGRPGMANGGWVAGLVAGLLTGPHTRAGTPIAVTPLAAVPLDARLTGRTDRERAFLDGADGSVVAEATLAADVPPPPPFVPLAEAQRAGGPGNRLESPFPGCYVCGFDREGGLRVTLGRAAGNTFAGVWTPPAAGEVPARYVWAALHCPAGLVHLEGGTRARLEHVTLAGHRAPVPGEPHVVVVAVPTGMQRRTRLSMVALYTSGGDLVAHGASGWIAG